MALGAEHIRLLLDGAVVTLQITLYSAILGTVIAIIGGVSSISHRRWVRGITIVYTELFRGVAALILLFIAYFSLPLAIGLQLSQMQAAVLALGTNMGAYGTEIVRGAINAIPRGQTEAGIAINLTRFQRYRYVILPQAIATMLPPFGNLMIEMMKATSLVYAIGLADLAYRAQGLRVGRVTSSAEIYGYTLLIYFAISLAITWLTRLGERATSRGRVDMAAQGAAR